MKTVSFNLKLQSLNYNFQKRPTLISKIKSIFSKENSHR